jgi:hypothetical protein
LESGFEAEKSRLFAPYDQKGAADRSLFQFVLKFVILRCTVRVQALQAVKAADNETSLAKLTITRRQDGIVRAVAELSPGRDTDIFASAAVLGLCCQVDLGVVAKEEVN